MPNWLMTLEPGHKLDSVQLVWAVNLQEYVPVIIHDARCPGCLGSPTVGREDVSGLA